MFLISSNTLYEEDIERDRANISESVEKAYEQADIQVDMSELHEHNRCKCGSRWANNHADSEFKRLADQSDKTFGS